jgi:hypothetical protein
MRFEVRRTHTPELTYQPTSLRLKAHEPSAMQQLPQACSPAL